MSLTDCRNAELCTITDEYTGGEARTIPGLVYVAFGSDGNPIIEHYSGTTGISSATRMSPDTIFWLASFTKLATSVACMQLVEQGVLNLDSPEQLEGICPELQAVKVLQRCPDGTFELVDKNKRISLRMLLNHTAGFAYAFEDAKLAEYGRPVGFDDFGGSRDDLFQRPLVNQPGDKFQYGTSMDWVGIVIERATGLDLEDYFRANIFAPLGMHSVSFFPSEDAKANLAYMHQRLSDGTLITQEHLYRRPLVGGGEQADDKRFCAAGHGCFGKPAEFRKLIAVLLNDGVDAGTGTRLLQSQTVEEMFTDQIPDKPRFSNTLVPVAKPWLANATPLSPMPEGHTEGWGLSFSISHVAEDGGRAAGSASWEGLANLFWFADRKNKVGGIIASQILPYGDAAVLECLARVEKGLYSALK
ncbi:beta-lactamase family protein [Cordyceps militaris CM01]|uniref:Beta-lactamase family protein n=1 Tax=Cordyceps militaris (strain CM01) TaxID=983644 RepID=G3JRJ3_CORMM|nr:beta-lactamase family protein [Cordyceps militaris CM01]EGX88596.1 beta-lactamase family protein [Cordyceps militaris CM01]